MSDSVTYFRWEADSKFEIHRERPSKRFVVMTLGGYWPRLLKLQDGRLMVVAREGDLHSGSTRPARLLFLSRRRRILESHPRDRE